MIGRQRSVTLQPLAVVALAALVGSACVSTPSDRSIISMRRANLSLAFSNPALADPVDPEVVVEVVRRVVPVDVQPVQPVATTAPAPSPGPVTYPAPELCPRPDPGTVPAEPALLNVSRPVEGFYTRINEGTVTITNGPATFEAPYPPLTLVEVRNVRVVEEPQPLPVSTTPTYVHFEVVEQIAPGYTELTEYRYDEARIELVRREVTNELGSKTFQPEAPITVLELAPAGTTWQSTGIDREAMVVRAISGTVLENEVVDLCGPRVDTVPGEVDVQDVDLAGASTYGTDLDRTNAQYWAPQFGALIVREERHVTEVIQTDDGAFTITYDVVGHLYDTVPIEEPSWSRD